MELEVAAWPYHCPHPRSQTTGAAGTVRVTLKDFRVCCLACQVMIASLWLLSGPQCLHLEDGDLDTEDSPLGDDGWNGDVGAGQGSTEVLPHLSS